MRRLTMLFPLLVLLAAALMPIHAQQETESVSAECLALVETAMSSLAANCAAAGGGAACVGSEAVSAVFAGATADFAAAGDIVDLAALQSVTTSTADVEAEQWGVARLNVFANVPLGLSPNGLTYLLLGDAEVLNAVVPETAFVPVEPIPVTVLVGANLRTAPSTDSTVLASANVGMQLMVDGISSDGAFLRAVTEDNQVVWISSQVVAPNEGDFNGLPVLTNGSRTLMQSIYLRTGGDSACGNAPSLFIAQSPGNFLGAITVNGADIRFDGTIAIYVSADNVMRLITLQGNAYSSGVAVSAGFTMDVQLSAEQPYSLAGAWSNLRPINDGERATLAAAGGVPQEVLYQAITIPSQEEVLNTLAAINGAAGVGGATGNGTLNCARFRPTSPLGAMPNGTANFYWDGVQGTTSYRVIVYNESGQQATSIEVNGGVTTLAVNTSPAALGGGSNFSWEVQALLNGGVACTTARASVIRDSTAQFVSGGSGGGAQIVPTVCTWDTGSSSFICG